MTFTPSGNIVVETKPDEVEVVPSRPLPPGVRDPYVVDANLVPKVEMPKPIASRTVLADGTIIAQHVEDFPDRK